MSGPDPLRTLAGLGEEALLARILPLLPGGANVLLGPGDDTALVSAPGGSVLATTDALVRQRDWRDDWSSGADVGAKAVVQNCADIAAMGGVTTGLLVTLVAEQATSLDWVEDFARGLGAAARAAGVPVVGGDLSSAPEGTLIVSVTALGDLEGRDPVRRSGAGVGDVVAVAGSLGRSAAGWLLLQRDEVERNRCLVDYHRRPECDLAAGPAAAVAGATAMLDVSDGLVRDAGRIGRASGVAIDLDPDLLAADVAVLVPAVGEEDARRCVLTGGEEHSLLACFPPGTALPDRWRPLGRVVAGQGVLVGGEPQGPGGGWDHFGG